MLLALNNVSFSFGARYIINEASWQINEGERIALVGPNGAGKSTILRLIMGEYSHESGSINKANDTSIGFFNQDLLSFSTDNSILSVAIGAFEQAKKIEAEIEKITVALESTPDDEKLLMKYSEALHDFEVAGGYEMDHKAAEVLEGLGFTTEQLQKPYNLFSGGWRMRVLLAKMMLQQPDILMLDEPTNHLDLPSIEWLEKYLISYPGTVIIVSHDRYFLDRMTTTTVELFMQKLHVYSGNYSFYQKEKATRLEFLKREFENQQQYIKQQEKFIERFRAQATKAAQAQSAIKRLDKLEKIELPDEKLQQMNISFDIGIQPGKIIAEVHHLSKKYDDNIILNNTNLELLRGDKVALVGANGKGKSTLLRILAETEAYEGTRSGGHNVQLSFYAQHQLESLNLDNTILEEMMQAGTGKTELELRQLLGCFIFTGDDVFKKIKVLSGGEKARVALAKVIASRSNFLLLDEPTNHLDMQSVEMLIEALQHYEGTYVIVSHDRYFVSRTANQYWEINEGKLRVHKGTYDEWEELKAKESLEKKVTKEVTKSSVVEKKETTNVAPNVVNNDIQKSSRNYVSKELSQAQKKVEQLEKKLAGLTDEKLALELQLSDPNIAADYQAFQKVDNQYNELMSVINLLAEELDEAIEKVIMLEDN